MLFSDNTVERSFLCYCNRIFQFPGGCASHKRELVAPAVIQSGVEQCRYLAHRTGLKLKMGQDVWSELFMSRFVGCVQAPSQWVVVTVSYKICPNYRPQKHLKNKDMSRGFPLHYDDGLRCVGGFVTFRYDLDSECKWSFISWRSAGSIINKSLHSFSKLLFARSLRSLVVLM